MRELWQLLGAADGVPLILFLQLCSFAFGAGFGGWLERGCHD